MDLKINIKSYVLAFIYILYSLLVLLLLKSFMSLRMFSMLFGLFAIVHLVLALSLLMIGNKKKLTFSVIFIILLYIFHCGQTVIVTFFQNYTFLKLDLLNTIGYEMYSKTNCYVMFILTFIVLGMWVNSIRTTNKAKPRKENIEGNENIKCRKIGMWIVLITLPINMIVVLNRIMLTLSGNYFDSYSYQISGYVSFLNDFLLVGVTFLMLGFSYSKKKTRNLYLLFCIYYCFSMLSGGRGKAVMSIVYLTFIYLKLFKMSTKTIIIFCVIGYLGLSILSMISVLRDDQNLTFSKVIAYSQGQNSPILNTLEEFGGTEYTTEIVISKVPKSIQYHHGLTYVESIISVLPNVGGIFTNINTDAEYVYNLNVSYIGGSLIGEIYYNFGYWGFIMAFIIGYFLNMISNNIEIHLARKQYYSLGVYSMLFIGCLWWIRDTCASITRNTIWSFLLLAVLSLIYNSITNYKREEILRSHFVDCIIKRIF